MENILLSEFDKQKNSVSSELKKKYNISDDDLDNIFHKIKSSLFEVINVIKEGKTAHEKFFSDIILNSVDAIIGFNNEFKIFLWNKGAERIFGYAKSDVMNKDFSFLIPDHLLKAGEKEFIINEVIEKGFLENYETERITKAGDLLNVSISRFGVYDQGEMIGSVGIIRDVTRVRTLEKTLQEKERLALIGEVVSNIAHSLSNPLNIISGNADYLMLDKRSTDREYDELKTIVEETARITNSIRHLLDFSRPVIVNKKLNDMNTLIDKVITNSKYIIGNKKITFEKKLQKDLPHVPFDESAIEELLNNLITNSIQSIPADGKVAVKTILNQKSIKIEISDTGIGIPKENLSKIFTPFFSLKEFGKGTGLGLSIAKRIINEHNGEIHVDSSPGKGSTFIIKLPK